MGKKAKISVLVVSLLLVILGLTVDYGTHIMIISQGIDVALLVGHAMLNIVGAALITLGLIGLIIRINMK